MNPSELAVFNDAFSLVEVELVEKIYNINLIKWKFSKKRKKQMKKFF